MCGYVANKELIENAMRSKRTGLRNCAQLERIWNAENCDPHELFNDSSLWRAKPIENERRALFASLRISEKWRLGCHGPRSPSDRCLAILSVWEFLPPIQTREFRPQIESEIPPELLHAVSPSSSRSPCQEIPPRLDISLLAPPPFRDSQRQLLRCATRSYPCTG